MRGGVASCPPTEDGGTSHAKDGAREPLARPLEQAWQQTAKRIMDGAWPLPAASGAPAGHSTRPEAGNVPGLGAQRLRIIASMLDKAGFHRARASRKSAQADGSTP
jgi:hypothetical protein